MVLATASAGITIDQLTTEKIIKIDGDRPAFEKFLSSIDEFSKWFNIVEP